MTTEVESKTKVAREKFVHTIEASTNTYTKHDTCSEADTNTKAPDHDNVDKSKIEAKPSSMRPGTSVGYQIASFH